MAQPDDENLIRAFRIRAVDDLPVLGRNLQARFGDGWRYAQEERKDDQDQEKMSFGRTHEQIMASIGLEIKAGGKDFL